MCKVLNVSRSTYYSNSNKPPSNRDIENQELRTKILTIYADSKNRLGAYKIQRRLFVEYGINISVGRVYRLMKSMQLPKMSTAKPRFISSSNEVRLSCPNHLKQQFNPNKPNLIWVSDITYVSVAGKFRYVCVVIDLFARKVISYKVSNKIDTKLVVDTFKSAYNKRNQPSSLMFHSDRGSQYNSKEFRKLLDSLNIVQSFSAKGHPYDNAVVESFFKYLKKEELDRRTFTTETQLKLSLFEYIESFYNPKRPHSANNFMSPDEKELAFISHL